VKYLGRTIREAEWLADVNILVDWGIEERSVDVKLTKFEIHGGYNGNKEPETSLANDKGEDLGVDETRALIASYGDEAGFQARDGTVRVGLDLVDPHGVDDHAVGRKID
jgi:hypothetical protein